MDVKETISINSRLVCDTAQIQNTNAAWLISLWHNKTAVYQGLSLLEIDQSFRQFN